MRVWGFGKCQKGSGLFSSHLVSFNIFPPFSLSLREDQFRREVNRTSHISPPAEPGELSGRRPQDVQPSLGSAADSGPLCRPEAAESSSSAVRRANEMLQDLSRLKSEMQTLLQVSFQTTETILTGAPQSLKHNFQL